MQDDSTWFPVFRLWCSYAFYVIVLGNKKTSPVRNYNTYYENLTNLLLYIAEWLESAQYFENISEQIARPSQQS
jgi:hypothetical protein